tara:strand:+ start:1129 stop:2760 length:1632 start_codon:yes stop_codon:yes gene_type:complete
MGQYDDGGVSFAEARFAEARAYKESVAKKENDLAKKLSGINLLGKGINGYLNQRGQEADDKNLWARGNYEDLLSKSDEVRTTYDANKKNGTSNLKYLETNLYNAMVNEATVDYAKADLDTLRPAFRKEANRLALDNLPEYEEMIENAHNIPSFGEGGKDFQVWFDGQQTKRPRNIAQWLGGKAKRILKTNNKETLQHKATQAPEYDANQAFTKFGELAESIKAYHAVTDKGFDLTAVIEKAKTDGLYLGKVVKINPDVTRPDEYDFRAGTKTTRVITSVLRENVNQVANSNGTISPYITDTYEVDKVVSQIKDNQLTINDRLNISKLVKLGSPTAKAIDTILGSTPNFSDASKAMTLINNNPQDLKVDWSDEKAFGEAFDNYYSSFIQFKKHPTKKGIYVGNWDNNKKGYVENPNYIDIIKQEEWDKETQRTKYRQLGNQAEITGSDNLDGRPTKTYEPIKSLLANTVEEQEIFKTFTSSSGSAFSASGLDLGRKIEEATTRGDDYVNLGRLDLGMVFGITRLEGQEEELYWDIANQTFVKGK